MEDKKTINPFIEEAKKFLKQDVVVTTLDNEKIGGNLRAICFNHLNCVIMTDKEKILVKNVKIITRKRDFVGTKP